MLSVELNQQTFVFEGSILLVKQAPVQKLKNGISGNAGQVVNILYTDKNEAFICFCAKNQHFCWILRRNND